MGFEAARKLSITRGRVGAKRAIAAHGIAPRRDRAACDARSDARSVENRLLHGAP